MSEKDNHENKADISALSTGRSEPTRFSQRQCRCCERRTGSSGRAGVAAAESQPKSTTQAPSSENPYGPARVAASACRSTTAPGPPSRTVNFYAPGTETLPKNEMRISFMGSTPFPVSQEQSGTCMLVELGNDTPHAASLLFRFGWWQHSKRDRHASAYCFGQRPFYQPSSCRPLR